MDIGSFDITTAIDIFLLLLIGIGPKIALVPFLEITSKLSDSQKKLVIRKMLKTAFTVALMLIIFGGILARLLHFTVDSLSIASGTILLALAIPMVIVNKENGTDNKSAAVKDPLSLAASPLAIPYLLNPVGIVVLITLSAESISLGVYGLIVLELLLVLVIDIAVFRWANRVSSKLDASRMLVIEKVFGFLLAALAVQLILQGASALGIIHLTGH